MISGEVMLVHERTPPASGCQSRLRTLSCNMESLKGVIAEGTYVSGGDSMLDEGRFEV